MKKVIISLRFSEAEKAKLVKLAKEQGTDLSKYCRNRVLHGSMEDLDRLTPDGKTIAAEDPKKVRRDADGLKPPCDKCVRLGAIGTKRNYNCTECGRESG